MLAALRLLRVVIKRDIKSKLFIFFFFLFHSATLQLRGRRRVDHLEQRRACECSSHRITPRRDTWLRRATGPTVSAAWHFVTPQW